MATGLKVDFYWYQLGTSDFVHSFFSTISFHLEKDGWGTKYPFLMKELYSGTLKAENVSKAIEEAKDVHEKLKMFLPSEVIWDIEDLSKQPPWGDKISSDITDLSNYFVTSDGKDMFEVLFYALNEALEENTDLEIKTL
ncbi:immunity 70 family protein [Bacillus arachidis]|uniref:Immunity 70 family protein n=1 Tax=Bacillus arachidis TaxID=2819290 RepID=A0ABS3P4S8_9BACI|nr:immunity 70 family protein [Bacillus arachidis]MBO1628174.1 immunity 70 family protein [Bacillus arachidis]